MTTRRIPPVPVSYRTPAELLVTYELVAELLQHIDDAESWPGQLGAYARARAAEIRAEFQRRERRP